VHEEDPLRVMRGLEQEGWLKRLVPGWSSAKANVAELQKLHEAQMQLQMQGIAADASAAQFPLLTAKMAAKDVKSMKKIFPRQGFVSEIDALEGEAKRFAAELGSKQMARPSATWKLLMAARPEVVLWVAYSTKNAALQAKFQSFYSEWPQARQRIPYVQMQEMRIVPELAGFYELVEKVFFELMDGKLGTVEEMKAFLEPYSPPAPPPPVHLRRARAAKKETKAKARKKAETDEGLAEDAEGLDAAALLTDVAASTGAAAGDKGAKATGTKAVEAKAVVPGKAAVPAKAVAPAKAAVAKTDATKAPVKKADAVKAVAKKAVAKKPVVANAAAKKASPAKKVAAKVVVKPKAKAVVKPKAKVVVKPKAKAVVKPKAKAAVKKVPAKVLAKSRGKVAAVKAKSKPGSKPAAKTSGKSKAKVPAKGASAKKR
jgi:tRNA nucleotidyltransferase (CCA-adding enzyme)